MNSLLGVEHSPSIPIVSKAPTLILGMDVSHGSPGQSDIPSIAAVIILILFYYCGPLIKIFFIPSYSWSKFHSCLFLLMIFPTSMPNYV